MSSSQSNAPASRCAAARALFCLLGPVLLAGCTGSGTVRVVPLMRTDFTPREPLVQEIPVDEAYYWVEDGQVNVALRHGRKSALSKALDYSWQMSLVLDELPAGSSRLYQLKADAVRIVQAAGADQRRSRTWTGIAVLEAAQGDRLEGRFHANVREQRFTLLGGWQPPHLQAPMMVVVGRFSAVYDAKLGQAIRHETEASGFERKLEPGSEK